MVLRSRRRFNIRSRKARRMGFRARPTRRIRRMTPGKVKRIIDAELKFRDRDLGPLDIPNAVGLVTELSIGIAQGDAVNERNGNWIKPVTLYGTITVQGNAVAVQDTSLFRHMIVVWKENETNNPIDLGQIVQSTVFPHQGFNVQNKGQYRILWSRTGIVSNNTDNPQFQKMHRYYVKPSMKILYDGNAPKNNQIFFISFSDINLANDPPNVEFSHRLRYTDS